MAIAYRDPENGDEPVVMAEMNITPLIDVLLVLLVMLIITIPIQLHAVNVELLVGPPPPVQVEPVVVVIAISASDQLANLAIVNVHLWLSLIHISEPTRPY